MIDSQIFKQDPFFKGKDNYDQLVKIARVLGTDELFAYLDKYDLELDSHFDGIMGRFRPRPFTSFIRPDNEMLCNDEALDFLSKLLRYDHQVSAIAIIVYYILL